MKYITANKRKILKQVSQKEITPEVAFQLLYCKKEKKAKMVRFQFYIKNKVILSLFANLLCIFPLPIFVVRLFLRYKIKIKEIPHNEIEEILLLSAGTSVEIESKEANIYLYIF